MIPPKIRTYLANSFAKCKLPFLINARTFYLFSFSFWPFWLGCAVYNSSPSCGRGRILLQAAEYSLERHRLFWL